MNATGIPWNECERGSLEAVQAIWALAQHLDVYDSSRRYDAAAFYRLATSHELPFESYGLSRVSAESSTPDFSLFERPTHNVIAEGLDTLTAHVGRNRPWVKVVTNGADGKVRKRARNRSRFFDGWAMEVNLYEYTRDCFRDMLMFGDAFALISSIGHKITIDRVLGTQLLVDPTEARFGKPRTLIRMVAIPRDTLLSLYPDHADAIKGAELIQTGSPQLGETPMTAVLEVWKLPPVNEEKGGRHMITISNAALDDEEWNRPTFPLARLSFTTPTAGYWSTGMVEDLTGYQLEINRLSDVITTMQKTMASPKWLAHTGSKVNKEALGGRYIGAVVEWSGSVPPSVVVPQAVPEELYAARQWWIDRARERGGWNQLASSGQLPMGVKSGEAIRSYNDIANSRHVILGQRLERFVLDIYKLVIAEAKTARPKVKVPGTNQPLLSWADCEVKEDEIFEAPSPISALPMDPSGRVDRIQEWYESGTITALEKMRYNDNLDVIAGADLLTSQAALVEQSIDAMIEDETYFGPEPYQDLNAAMTDAQLRYCAERLRGTNEGALELIRRYIEDVRALGGQPPETAEAASGVAGTPSDVPTDPAAMAVSPPGQLASATQPLPQG